MDVLSRKYKSYIRRTSSEAKKIIRKWRVFLISLRGSINCLHLSLLLNLMAWLRSKISRFLSLKFKFRVRAMRSLIGVKFRWRDNNHSARYEQNMILTLISTEMHRVRSLDSNFLKWKRRNNRLLKNLIRGKTGNNGQKIDMSTKVRSKMAYLMGLESWRSHSSISSISVTRESWKEENSKVLVLFTAEKGISIKDISKMHRRAFLENIPILMVKKLLKYSKGTSNVD